MILPSIPKKKRRFYSLLIHFQTYIDKCFSLIIEQIFSVHVPCAKSCTKYKKNQYASNMHLEKLFCSKKPTAHKSQENKKPLAVIFTELQQMPNHR